MPMKVRLNGSTFSARGVQIRDKNNGVVDNEEYNKVFIAPLKAPQIKRRQGLDRVAYFNLLPSSGCARGRYVAVELDVHIPVCSDYESWTNYFPDYDFTTS